MNARPAAAQLVGRQTWPRRRTAAPVAGQGSPRRAIAVMLRMAVSCLCLLGGLARGAGAQAARTGPDAATFDLQDRRAQNLLVALRCAQRVSEL
ncbi:MAG: hypothetical protein KJZ47_15340, partial [Gemmatimonadales bacterium]|nr:hypothetical protein [Gemmatimonadales bacterium]